MNSLYHPTDSRIHGLPAAPKIVAALLFVMLVVAVPAGQWTVLAGVLALAFAACLLAALPVRLVARRMVVETPFLLFALAMPFIAAGERVQVGPISLSRLGMIGAGTLLLKATTGVVTAIALSATTSPRELLAGVEQLRLPAPLVSIASFMVRYAGVVTGDLARMRKARLARGFNGGRLAHLRIEAAGTATLFIRSYERGERIHRAMMARGYTGRMPALSVGQATAGQWVAAMALPAAALIIAVMAGAWR